MIEPARTEGVHCNLSKGHFCWWQNPRFVHQLGDRYLTAPNPRIVGAGHDDKRVLKKKFEIERVLDSGGPNPCDQEVELTLAQFLIDDFGLRNHELNNDAGK